MAIAQAEQYAALQRLSSHRARQRNAGNQLDEPHTRLSAQCQMLQQTYAGLAIEYASLRRELEEERFLQIVKEVEQIAPTGATF